MQSPVKQRMLLMSVLRQGKGARKLHGDECMQTLAVSSLQLPY